MANVGKVRAVRGALCAGTFAVIMGLSGCALTVPAISEVQEQTVSPTVSDSNLVSAGTLTVALDTDNAPYGMTSGDSVTGYSADVARALAQRMGLKVQFVNASSASSALSGGKADIYMDDDDSTSSTTSGIASAGTFMSDATAIFGASSQAGSSVSASTLENATIGVQSSSASQDVLTRCGIASGQQTYSTINECFEALAKGEVQYVACDAEAGGYVSRIYADVSFIGTLSDATSGNILTSSSASELSSAVEAALETIEADGTLDAVQTKWFGDTPSDLSDTKVSGITIKSSTKGSDSGDEEDEEGADSESTTSSTTSSNSTTSSSTTGSTTTSGSTASSSSSTTGTNSTTGTTTSTTDINTLSSN